MRRLLLLLCLLASPALAGSKVLIHTTVDPDTVAPSAPGSVVCSAPIVGQFRCDWVAPGDDGGSGTAASYDLRYESGTCPMTFSSATQETGEPTPSIAGSAENMNVTDAAFTAGTTWSVEIRASDEVPNTSASSTCEDITIPSGCDTTDVDVFWGCQDVDITAESGTTDFSAGDKIASPTGTGLTLTTSAAKLGATGVYTDSSGDYYSFDVSAGDLVDGTSGCMGAWFQYPSSYPGTSEIIAARTTSGSANGVRLQFSGSSSARTMSAVFQDGTNTTTVTSGSTNQISAGNWYWGEVCWNAAPSAGSDTLYLNVYNSSLTFITAASASTTTATMAAVTPTLLRVGRTNSANAADVYIDHPIVSADHTDDLSTCANQANYNGS